MYSASKAGRLNISDSGASDFFFGTPAEASRLGHPVADSDPVYLLRAAMSKLEELSSENSDEKALDPNASNEVIFGVLQLLSGAEEKLDQNLNSSWYNSTNKDDRGDSFIRTPLDKENSAPNTPVVDKKAQQIAELIERLEVVEGERDEQAGLVTSLQQELKQKDEELALKKSACDDLMHQLVALREEGDMEVDRSPTPAKAPASKNARSPTSSEKSPSSARKVIDTYMANQIDLNEAEQNEYEAMAEDLMTKLEEANGELLKREKELQEASKKIDSQAEALAEKDEEIEDLEGAEATLKTRMLALESRLLQVRGGDGTEVDLENDVSMNIMDLNEKLSEEREKVVLLQNMLEDLKETNGDNEEMLELLETDKLDLEQDFKSLEEQYTSQMEQIGGLEQQVKSLSIELTATKEVEKRATERRVTLEDELAAVKEELVSMGSDVKAEGFILNERLNDLSTERTELKREVMEQARLIEEREQQLAQKEDELARTRAEFNDTQAALQEALDEVEQESRQRSKLMEELQGLLLLRNNNNSSLDFSFEEDGEVSHSGLYGSPDTSVVGAPGSPTHPGADASSIEVEHLAEKLEDAEKRATEALQSGIDQMAQTAILDGECRRLKEMTSDLKEKNTRLTLDVETAKREAERYKLLEKAAKKLKADLAATRAALHDASEDKKRLQERSQFQEAEIAAQFDANIDSLQEKVNTLQKELEESQRIHQEDRTVLEEQKTALELSAKQLEEFRVQESASESEYQSLIKDQEDMQEEVDTLKNDLEFTTARLDEARKELVAAEVDARRSEEASNQALSTAQKDKSDLERRVATLSGDLAAKERQIKDLDALREENVEQINSLQEKVTAASAENGDLIAETSKQEEELAKRLKRISEYSDQVDELEDKYNDFVGGPHKLLQDKCESSECARQDLERELLELQEASKNTEKDLEAAQERYSDLDMKYTALQASYDEIQEKDLAERESRVRELQQELQAKLHEEASMQAKLMEQDRQMDQLTRDVDAKEEDNASKGEQLRELESRLGSVEEERRLLAEKYQEKVVFETELSSCLAAVSSTLAECTQMAPPGLETSGGNAPLSPSPRNAADALLSLTSSAAAIDLSSVSAQLTKESQDLSQIMSTMRRSYEEKELESQTQRDTVDALESRIKSHEVLRDKTAAQVRRLEETVSARDQGLAVAERHVEQLQLAGDTWKDKVKAQVKEISHFVTSTYSQIRRLHAISPGSVMLEPIPEEIDGTMPLTSDDETSSNMLEREFLHMEKSLRLLAGAMETSLGEAQSRKIALDSAEASLEHQKKDLQEELDNSAVLEEKLLSQSEDLQTAQELRKQLYKVSHEHAQYKLMLSELNKNKAELQTECDASQAIIVDMRAALEESEKLCRAYQAQHRTLLEENDKLATSVKAEDRAAQALKERAAQQQEVCDKMGREVQALKGEIEEARVLQKAMETELARERDRVVVPPSPGLVEGLARSDDDEDIGGDGVKASPVGVTTYDSERLLGALYSTTDQLLASSVAQDVDGVKTTQGLKAMSALALESSDKQGMLARYDAAIRYLTELRVWDRHEKKARRDLMLTASEGVKEIEKAKSELKEERQHSRQLKEAKYACEAEIRVLEKKLRDLFTSNEKRGSEIDKTRRSVSTLERRCDEEKRARVHAISQLHQAEVDLKTARKQVQEKDGEGQVLNNQLMGATQRADQLEREVERSADEVRSLKSQNRRLVTSLETGASHTHANNPSHGAAETPGHRALVSTLQERVDELEQNLRGARQQIQVLKQGKSDDDVGRAAAKRESEALISKFGRVMAQYESVEGEKRRLQKELSEVKGALSAAEQRAKTECDRANRAEASWKESSRPLPPAASDPALTTLVEANQRQIQMLQTRLDEADKGRKDAEMERTTLRSQLSELRSSWDKSGTEKAEKGGLEAELERLKEQLQRSEPSVKSAESGDLRASITTLMRSDEGRELRRQVGDATFTAREVVNLIRADAVSAEGTYFNSPDAKPNHSLPHSALLEATGIRELTDALAALKSCIGWLQQAPQHRDSLKDNNQRQEEAMRDLQRELSSVHRKHEAVVTRLRAEAKAVEAKLDAESVKNASLQEKAVGVEAEHRALVELKGRLHASVQEEKRRSQSLADEVQELQLQLEEVGALLDAKASELTETKAELEGAKEGAKAAGIDHDEAMVVQQELRAVSHHRDTLRATVARLEEKIKLLSSASATATTSKLVQDDLNSPLGEERYEARLRARLDAAEGVLDVYRKGIIALYTNSSSYSYAQYAAAISKGYGSTAMLDESVGASVGSWQGWGSRELSLLRTSFEAELKVLESEVIELRGKVRQSNAFSAELSKRFQTVLSQSFAGSTGDMDRDSSKSSLIEMTRHLEGSVGDALEEAAKLRTTLHDEKEQTRRRHRQLMDVLHGTVSEKEALEAALKALEVSGVDVPPVVRRGDYLAGQHQHQMHSHQHQHHMHSRDAAAFQSPVKTYRARFSDEDASPLDPEPLFAASPSPVKPVGGAPHISTTTTATATATTRAYGNGSSAYRLKTRGNAGKAALRVRRAGGSYTTADRMDQAES